MPQYALVRHVFSCLEGEHVVFLDVRNDRYHALESEKARGFGSLVLGWPVQADEPPALDEEAASALALLIESGLIEQAPAGEDSRPYHTAERFLKPPSAECVWSAFDHSPRIGAKTLCRFIVSAVAATLILRFRSFETAVHRVQHRNLTKGRVGGRSLDPEMMHDLVSKFALLRPYFFASKDECLFESLALSEFLAKHGAFPRWVFGVQSRPFAAHCWLQADGVVLNDTVEHVRQYAPIMAV